MASPDTLRCCDHGLCSCSSLLISAAATWCCCSPAVCCKRGHHLVLPLVALESSYTRSSCFLPITSPVTSTSGCRYDCHTAAGGGNVSPKQFADMAVSMLLLCSDSCAGSLLLPPGCACAKNSGGDGRCCIAAARSSFRLCPQPMGRLRTHFEHNMFGAYAVCDEVLFSFCIAQLLAPP